MENVSLWRPAIVISRTITDENDWNASVIMAIEIKTGASHVLTSLHVWSISLCSILLFNVLLPFTIRLLPIRKRLCCFPWSSCLYCMVFVYYTLSFRWRNLLWSITDLFLWPICAVSFFITFVHIYLFYEVYTRNCLFSASNLL